MEQPSTSRPKLIPRKFGSVSNQHHSMRDNNDNFAQNRGLKRKNEDEISVGGKRSFAATPTDSNSPGKKFSANARLSQYRKALESKQNEVVKVHTLQKAVEDVHVHQVQGGCHAVSPAACGVNQRLKVSVKEDFKRKAQTVSAKEDCSRKFEAVANTVNQRLSVSMKEDCRRKAPTISESLAKEDYSHKFDVFAEAVNRHFSIAVKDDCRRKAQTFPPIQGSPVKEDCSRKFEASTNVVNQRLNASVKEDYRRKSQTIRPAQGSPVEEDCSRKFEAFRNTVKQRGNAYMKEDCSRNPQTVPANPTKEDFSNRFEAFAKTVNRDFNVAVKDDRKRKAQAVPPVQESTVKEDCSQKFEAFANAVNQRLSASMKEDCRRKSETIRSAQGSPMEEDCSRKFEAVSPVPSNRRNSFVKEDFAQNLNINARLNKYKDSALEQKQNSSSFESEETGMDWSPINEEQLIADINNIRQHTSEILNHKSSFQASISDEIPRNDFIFKDTFIVVDTNIFISHLNVVRFLLDVKQNGVDRPFVLIPWVVIQELDYMKAGRDGRKVLQISARKAVDFINENLLLKNTTMKGQSVIDATKHSIPCNNLDDGILACCLQVIERGNRAILLSNDKNLRNKSLVNAVPAHSSDEIFRQLGVASPTKRINSKQNIPKSDEVKRQLTTLFNTIIHSEALSAYGEVYHKMGVFKDAPWNLEQCLQKFEKLWIAVFSEKLPKQCLQNIEEFKKFLSSRKWISTETDHERLIKFGLNVCLFLKNGLNEYRQLIAECIDRIVKLA